MSSSSLEALEALVLSILLKRGNSQLQTLMHKVAANDFDDLDDCFKQVRGVKLGAL